MDRRQFNSLPLLSLGVIAALAVQQAHALTLADLSSADASRGLKTALEKGALSAVGLLGVKDGFLGNPQVRIPLPGYLNDAAQLLRTFGQGDRVDELLTAMNRAAETAVPQSRELLLKAVKNMSVTDAKGKTTTVPLSDQQIEQMTALVRETIGFNKDRGDSVNLMNAPFTLEKTVVTDVPLWKQPEIQDLARSFAWPLGTLLFGALVLLGVIRPGLKALAQSQPPVELVAHQLDAIESDEPDRPQLGAPEVNVAPAVATASELALEDARKLTRDNPAAVANIVKSWISGEPA